MPCCWQSSAALVDSLWFLRRARCHSRDALFACLILITAEQLPRVSYHRDHKRWLPLPYNSSLCKTCPYSYDRINHHPLSLSISFAVPQLPRRDTHSVTGALAKNAPPPRFPPNRTHQRLLFLKPNAETHRLVYLLQSPVGLNALCQWLNAEQPKAPTKKKKNAHTKRESGKSAHGTGQLSPCRP